MPNIVVRTSNYLGRSSWGQDGYYQGKMDDVRIYNRVLGPAAVLALANGGGADDAFADRPALSARPVTPNGVLLSWPASAGAFVLQQSPTLSPGAWTAVTDAPALLDGWNQATVSATNAYQFYRLYLP